MAGSKKKGQVLDLFSLQKKREKRNACVTRLVKLCSGGA
jgi:hypothetical protein